MSLTLLVVDDSAVMRSMLIRTVRLSGLPVTAVHQAGSCADALGALRRGEVQAALIDAHVPPDDAGTLLEQVRSDASLAHVGVVMLGADGALAGARGTAVVSKPFTPDQIRVAVLQVLGMAAA